MNKKSDKEDFERELSKIKDWQRHANNPGHWHGGLMPFRTKKAFDTPVYTISFGTLLLLFFIFSMVTEIINNEKDFVQILKSIGIWIIPVILSFSILLRGIKLKRHKSKKL